MVETDHIEVWNLTQDGVARSGAVDIFNVVGRVKDAASVDHFAYRLNGGPETPIFFARSPSRSDRLRYPGDFNVDTIALADLRPENRLHLRVRRADGADHRLEVRFRCAPFDQLEPRFDLDLNGITGAEEVGQVVEGPWRIAADEVGRRCLEIAPEDAGYDRIILFGREDWTTGYELHARLAVTRITGNHNIGLVFKWNPHERGDGSRLPSTWSTGLGYYCSYGDHPGIRIRFGVRVHVDGTGRKRGDHLLTHRPLTTAAQIKLNRLKARTRLVRWPSEVVLDRVYGFRMHVHPKRYALTVWNADRKEPAPQLVVNDPIDRLPRGAVGILAYNVGVRLYEFDVRPLTDTPSQ